MNLTQLWGDDKDGGKGETGGDDAESEEEMRGGC